MNVSRTAIVILTVLGLTATPRVLAQYNYSLNHQTNTINGGVKPGYVDPGYNSWIDGTGKWETAGNWSSGHAPSSAEDGELITNAGNNTVTIDATTVLSNAISGCLTVKTLTVSAPSGLTNTLALRNAGLSTPLLIKGAVTLGGGGIITITNSTLEVDTTGAVVGFDGVLVGVVGSGNTLAITNGGQVVNSLGFIGLNQSSSNNVVLVTGTGSVWSNSYLYVGYDGAGNQLTITNGGLVVNDYGFLGTSNRSSNNLVLVTGSGSLWSNAVLNVGFGGASNQLTIANSGLVVNDYGYLGANNSRNNAVLVTGPGSVWSNRYDLSVGYGGAGNQLTITNGGLVVNNYGNLGFNAGGSNNVALVTGAGSVWSNRYDLYVGDNGAGNQLTIADGGLVVNDYGDLGANNGSNNAVLVTDSGSVWSNRYDLYVGWLGTGNQLTVTNNGTVFANNLVLGRNAGSPGTLTFAGGSANITSLIVTNAGSAVVFNSGTLNTAGAAITNGLTFADGDGLDTATYHLLGGIHSFANGLEILNSASLTGCGTVDGNVVVDLGGTVQVDCGGTLTFTGIVTNNGTMRAINGSVLEAYSNVVNNGLIDIADGTTNFHGGFINNGVVCSQLTNTITTSISPAGSGYTSGGGTYPCGSGVTVCAAPYACQQFANWTDQNSNVVSSSSCYSFTAASDETLTANFTPITTLYTVTTRSSPPNGGTTSGGGTVPCGSNVTVCATANPGYVFLHWAGGSKSNCYTFTPVNNATLTALFGRFQITGLAVQSNNVWLTWIAPYGSTNLLLSSKGGPGGGYSNLATNFLVAPPFVMPPGGLSDGASTNYLDVGGATNKPSRYYRVYMP
jgi:T5SS/PEP-CTERM-associated repeat protein